MSYGNSAQNAAVEVAAFSVGRALGGGLRGGVAGLVVQPVVWAVTGSGPDAGDTVVYGTGVAGVFAGAIVAVPALITGIIKAAVDDHTASLVAEAKQDEPREVRQGIFAVDDYSFAAGGGHIQAMTIASFGGVVWQHPNGVYLFMKDASGRAVCDFEPRAWTKKYAPRLPLQLGSNGRVNWRYETNRRS